MKDRNSQLKQALGRIPQQEVVKEVVNMPEYDSVNREGFAAYAVDDELRLLSMLNTLKVEPQFYRSENTMMKELQELVWKIAKNDPYLVAQMIVWSRCCGEGMRSVNHLAAALIAPFVSGEDWGKRFYGAFNKKTKNSGGCIYRLDDMSEIKDVFSALNKTTLTNAMKKGFASVLVNASAYELAKYKKTTIDISRLTHPDVSKSGAEIEIDGETYKVIDAILQGMPVSADTWEKNNSEAGQIVAEAVKQGKISTEKAKEVLKEAKNDNWEGLLAEGKLGILAAIRNLRNMLSGDRESVIELVGKLVSDGAKIRDGKIMPYQLEQAMDVVMQIGGTNGRKLLKDLEAGMVAALPNLKEQLPGENLIMVDCSGSMSTKAYGSRQSCLEKAAILAAMLAKGTDADIILFGSSAEYLAYNANDSLKTISEKISTHWMGGTNISAAFDLIRRNRNAYDRIFLISDNEANYGCTRSSYTQYIKEICSPYVYCVDMASYGTTPIRNEGKVNYYFGYGYSMLDDVARLEFNPQAHIEKVKKIVI